MSHKRYGALKIHVLLNRTGYTDGINRAQRLLREASIRSIVIKKLRPTPSKAKIVEHDNLLDQDFSTKTINKK